MKMLVLVDGLVRGKLPGRTSAFLEALAAVVDPVLVSESYQRAARSVRGLPFPHETFGFSAETYDADMRTLSHTLIERHSPTAVVSYGWENAQLVFELFRRRLPVVMFVDCPPKNLAATENIKWSFQFTEAVFFTQEAADHLPVASSSKFRRVEFFDEVRALRRSFVDLFGSRERDAQRRIAACLAEVSREALHRRSLAADQSRRDADAVRASHLFDEALFEDPDDVDDDDLIERYLFDSWRCIPRRQTLAGCLVRRPTAGFHPLVYATQNDAFDETLGEDPLVHYVRAGRPDGPWTHQIIQERADVISPIGPRSALHIHMHYPELLPDLLARLETNDTRPDLFITTTSDDRLELIDRLLSETDIKPRLVETETTNKGRDIWPFIRLLEAGAFEDYDVVGHVHGKRSPTNKKGEAWRLFLWRHLIGGPEPLLDRILSHFQNDAGLGLVIPENPNLQSWADNLDMATALASKMGLPLPLPSHFEFPQGTMFWARPQALAPLLALELTDGMIPPEPIGDDGTILHAIERIIPFAVAKAGYRMAATQVPGSRW